MPRQVPVISPVLKNRAQQPQRPRCVSPARASRPCVFAVGHRATLPGAPSILRIHRTREILSGIQGHRGCSVEPCEHSGAVRGRVAAADAELRMRKLANAWSRAGTAQKTRSWLLRAS